MLPSVCLHSNACHLFCPFINLEIPAQCNTIILSFAYWEDLSTYVGLYSSNDIVFITDTQGTQMLVISIYSFLLLSPFSIQNNKVPLISMVTE